ncbi:alcohol dehydrogenase [Penicillium verhagenii]|nr:alcohol dehydrogenase [Penicillium verhagenii]
MSEHEKSVVFPIKSTKTTKTMPEGKPMMIAIRFHGRSDIRVDTVEEPRCGKSEVKMRLVYVGIYGSEDLHEYTAGPVLIPQAPHLITGSEIPVTMGHEFSGIVEEVGEDNIGFIGLSGYGGGLAEHIVAPAKHYYPIPDNVSLEIAALVEPLAVAWHALNVSPFRAKDNVLVLQGAREIVVVELMWNRKQLALDFGAIYVLDPWEVDVPMAMRNLTNGIGADVVFDTVGVEAALNGAILACRVFGTIVNIAVKYIGAALYDETSFQDVIRALGSGQLNPAKMITSKIKLHEVVEKGFEALFERRDRHCKILVDVQNR